jgi:hypothetical protein
MRKFTALATAALLLSLGASSAQAVPLEAPAVTVEASIHAGMLADMRANMTTGIKDKSDTALLTQAYAVCTTLLVQDKDTYRENTLAKYPLDEALDRLVLAAAAKHHLCG